MTDLPSPFLPPLPQSDEGAGSPDSEWPADVNLPPLAKGEESALISASVLTSEKVKKKRPAKGSLPTDESASKEEITDSAAEPTADLAADSSRESTENAAKADSQASVSLKDMVAAVEEQPDVEAKLTVAIAFMERAMGQKDSPDFRTFYALRKICQELFRGSVAAGLRQKLWGRYSELQDEARRLKQILDEESDFAVEQIEIAVKGLEEELRDLPKLLEQAPELPLSATVKALKETFEEYVSMQKELQLLNACAARIHSLRKELMRTPMRIGQKNRFFHRLSVAGDAVFPRRKELMGLISTRFLADVETFSKDLLAKENLSEMVFFLREEVKAFQHYAKLFTLNPKAFNRVRAELGACWEKLREAEKEHRKERAKLRVVSQANMQKVEAELEEANSAFTAGTLTVDEGKQKVDGWISSMRTLELDRDAFRLLQGKVRTFREKLLDTLRSAEELRQREQKAREQERRAALLLLREQVDRLIHGAPSFTSEALAKEYTALAAQIEQSTAQRAEKLELQRRLRPIRDAITEKKAQELLALPPETREVAQQLHALLESHLQQRNEIRTQLEEYRAQQSLSGQNFAQALTLREQVQEEKERLARLDAVIEEIATKLADIAG